MFWHLPLSALNEDARSEKMRLTFSSKSRLDCQEISGLYDGAS